jgi:tetratricopeptide (TPR) repeat protein
MSPVLRQISQRRQIATDFVIPFQQQGVEALQREHVRRALDRLAEDLRRRAEEVRRAGESESTVPPYNVRFSGRLDELLWLRTRLQDDRAGVVCGVHGLGGIGKTELAFTYAHAFASAYPGGRFLVACEAAASLREAIVTSLGGYFASQIDEEARKTPDTHFAAVTACLRDRLHTHGHILLVLDNVVDPVFVTEQTLDCVTSLGPTLHVLATTRLEPHAPATTAGAATVERRTWLTLGALPNADALDLLEKHRPFGNDPAERAAAERIVQCLGGFTLAVELVAAWLSAQGDATSYAAFAQDPGLADLEDVASVGELGAPLRRHNDERRLTSVLRPVLGSLDPPARRAMEYAAFLAPDSVPLDWLETLVTADFPAAMRPTRLVARPWKHVVARLEGLALLTRSGAVDGDEHVIVRVHRLVQELVRLELPGERSNERASVVDGDEHWIVRMRRLVWKVVRVGLNRKRGNGRVSALEALVRERAGALQQTTQWTDARWEIEPLTALAYAWADSGHPDAAWLLSQSGDWWHTLAEWGRCEPLMRRVLAIHERTYGTEHPEVAAGLNNLALLLMDTNRVSEAEPLMRRAVGIDEASFGAEHPDTAGRLNNLANLLYATNRLPEAEALMRRALAVDERSYGKEHPNVATDLNSLALLLLVTNRFSEAEPLMRCVLSILEARLGCDHPNVATALSNLGGLLSRTNRLSEAEPLMRRALAIHEANYGKDHPDVATTLTNMTQLLQAANRLLEAEPLMRRVVSIYEASMGPEHPNVATAIGNLASLLQATNRLSEAEPLMRRALAIDEASYGKVHPNVARDLHYLASLLYATNRLSEAEPLTRRALAIYETAYGVEHPNVATVLNDLALLLQATNRLSEAEPLMRRALAVREHALVLGHPHTLGSMHSLADILEALDRNAEARELRRRRLAFLTGRPDQPPLALRSFALDAYNLADYALATDLLQHVLAAGFEPSGTHCHLARLALIQDDVPQAALHADAAWANRAAAEPYVVPRILWLQLACALLAGQTTETRTAAAAIGMLKSALAAEDVIHEWTMEPVIERLASRLSATDTDLLRDLVAAMSFPGRPDGLDALPLWRDTEPVPIPPP